MGWLVTSLMLAASATLGFDAPPKVAAKPSPTPEEIDHLRLAPDMPKAAPATLHDLP